MDVEGSRSEQAASASQIERTSPDMAEPAGGQVSNRPFFCGRWPFLVLLAPALIGAFATGFLSYRHVLLASHSSGVGESALCRAHGVISCDGILLSEYATLFGHISSAVLGLMGFAFVLWCVLNALFNERIRKVAWVLLVLYFFAAIGFSWYYVYIMLFQVDFICTWCIAAHVMNLFSLITVVVISIKNGQAFLLREVASLAERTYFIAGGVLTSLLIFFVAGMWEKNLSFEDAKVRYEEIANDYGIMMAALKTSPTYDIPIGPEDPVFGNPAAPYPIILFSDFQCPVCARTDKALRELVNRNGNLLQLVFKNYPLSSECNAGLIPGQSNMHPLACVAGRAAYAAFLLGGSKAFWAYADLLFTNQKEFRRDPWLEFAEMIKLHPMKFAELMKPDSAAAEKVATDADTGIKLGINATPQVFFLGKRMPETFKGEYLFDALEELIRDADPGNKNVQLRRR